MAISGKQSSVIVKGNTIGNGRFTDGTTATNYQYDKCIYTSADAQIHDNVLSGVKNNSSTTSMLHLNGGNCIVTGNKFVRDTSSIYAYIYDESSKDQLVTNNSFDLPTTDGYVETLVQGFTASSTYTENKNQTCFKYIPLYDMIPSTFGGSGYISPAQAVSPYSYSVVRVTDTNNAPQNGATQLNVNSTILNFWLPINISRMLPNNVTVTQCRLGAFKFAGTINNTPYNTLNQIALQYSVSNDSVTMDVKNQYDTNPLYNVNSIFTILNGTQDGNISSNTQYLTTTPLSNNYLNNSNSTTVSVLCFIEFDGTGAAFYLSPLEIKYRW